MCTPAKIRFRQTGSGLLEVLVLIVVMAIGMMAMGKMHTILIRDGGTANNRAIATSLAQEKIDDLRGFKWIDTNGSNGEGCGNGIFCYSEIGTNTGGAESGANLLLPSGNVTVGNTTFSRTWASVDNTTFKLVTVTISWTDQNGTGQLALQTAIYATDNNVTALQDSGYGSGGPGPKVPYNPISAPDAVAIGIGGGKSTETSKPLPEVEGAGSLTVTFPSVVYGSDYGDGVGYVLDSQEEFKTVNCTCTMQSSGGGYTPFRTVWDPDYKTVESYNPWLPGRTVSAGARRTYDGNNYEAETSGTTGTLPPTHTNSDIVSDKAGTDPDGIGVEWSYLGPVTTTLGGLVTEFGELVSTNKASGVPSDLNNGNTSQSEFCFQCCRDHHDAGTSYPTYRPYVTTAEFDVNGNHKHYKVGAIPGAANSVAGDGDDYVEACRMKRINGVWRVYPDWNQVDLMTFACDYFATSPTATCPPNVSTNPTSSTKLANYRGHIQNVLKQFADYVDDNKTSSSLPVFTINAGSNPSPSVSALLNPATDSDDIDPSRQLIARALYADVIFEPKKAGKDPRRVDALWAAKVVPIFSNSDNGNTVNGLEYLKYLPFYDSNVTLLTKWRPTSTNTSGGAEYGDCSKPSGTISWSDTPSPSAAVCVTNEAIDTIDETTNDYYDDSYSRGQLSAKGTAGQETLITAYMDRGNNGLTSSASITALSGYGLTSTVNAKIPGANTISAKMALVFYSVNDSCKVATGDKATVHNNTSVSWTSGATSGACSTGSQGSNYWYTCTGIPDTATSINVTFDTLTGYSIRDSNNASSTWADPYVHLTTVSPLNDPAATMIVRHCAP